MLGKLGVHMQKNEIRHTTITLCQNYLQKYQRLNMKPEVLETLIMLENNLDTRLQDIGIRKNSAVNKCTS